MRSQSESGARPGPPPILRTLRSSYTYVAIMVLDVALILLFVNLLLSFTLSRQTQNPITKHGLQTVMAAYPGARESDVRALLRECWDMGRFLDHHPYAQFKNAPRNGSFVTVREPGFRVIKDQAPWPPSPTRTNVFFFGGSTAFGLGVANEQTAPSYLQEVANQVPRTKPLAVYNFGVPAYIGGQEMAFLLDLVANGIIPDAVVFLDGFNELAVGDPPALTLEISRYLRGYASRDILYQRVPLVRVTVDALRRMQPKAQAASEPSQRQQEISVDAILDRWRSRKGMIESVAKIYGFKVLMVWQPIPQFHYDMRYHAICRGRFEGCLDIEDPTRHRYGYGKMNELYLQGALGSDFLWLADMQLNRKENFYVDSVHYTPAFNREIATRIQDALQSALAK